MNPKIGTYFGLPMLMAIGALVTMFALGMFWAKEARADHVTTNAAHLVSMTPTSLSVNAKSAWTVTLGVSGADLTVGSGTVSVTFPDGVVIPPIEKTRVAAGSDVAGSGEFALFPLTSDPTVHGQTVNLTIPATKPGGGAITGDDRFLDGDQIRVVFNLQAGLVNPAKSGSAGSISAGTAGQVSTSVQTTNGNIPTALSFTRTISLGGKTFQAEGGAVTVTVGGFTPGLTVSLSGAVSGSAIVGHDSKAVISGTMNGTGGTVTATDTSGGTATSGTISVSPSLSVTETAKAPKPTVTLSASEAEVGAAIVVEAAGFPPSLGLSVLTIGGVDVRSGVVTSDTEGGLTASFIVPGVTGSNIVTVTIGGVTVSTSIIVLAAKAPPAAASDPETIFADVIANDDNLVRLWRFDNATQRWAFYDPRPEFEAVNTLDKSRVGDIVWVNVVAEQAFQGGTLFPGWNLITLNSIR